MPLLIDLKPGERLIINGAVLENAGGGVKLRIHNNCNVLRQKEILTEEDVSTPASRVYFCLQCAYLFPNDRARHLNSVEIYLTEYMAACPSAYDIVKEITTEVANGRDYHAVRAARKLLQHEANLASQMLKSMEKTDEPTQG